MLENLDHPGIDMDRPAPYAGFYANLVGVSNSTKIIFLVEFSLLFLMGIMMYGFYLRERHIKSKIKGRRQSGDMRKAERLCNEVNLSSSSVYRCRKHSGH